MKVACAFDHAGFPLKQLVMDTVVAAGHEPVDLGTFSTDPVDYPDTARAAAEAVLSGAAERAVLVCGSGAGVAVLTGQLSSVVVRSGVVPPVTSTGVHVAPAVRRCSAS